MFNYTIKLTLDTFDYIKKIISVFDIFFQIFYIFYLGYRIYTGAGLLPTNIILILLSVFYFIYSLCTRQEFYTKRERRVIRNVKETIKITKRLTNLVVIIVAVMQLVNNTNTNNNLSLLLTLIMIMGYIISIIFDIIIKIIDYRVELYKCAFPADLAELKKFVEGIPMVGSMIGSKMNLPNESELDDEILSKLKDIRYKQEDKKRRKDDYLRKHN